MLRAAKGEIELGAERAGGQSRNFKLVEQDGSHGDRRSAPDTREHSDSKRANAYVSRKAAAIRVIRRLDR